MRPHAIEAERLARRAAFVLLTFIAALALIAVATHWYFEDAGAYWKAAMRVRTGERLYVDHLIDSELYRYAPWFAYAWVPLTHLPEELVMGAWAAGLIAAAAYLAWPDWRRPHSVALSLLVLPDLARVTSTGNVQPLLLALTAVALRSSWGPVVVGAMASLKVWPIVFAAVYGWRRDWIRMASTLGVMTTLMAPTLLFDLGDYPPRQLVTPGTLSILLVVARVARHRGPRADASSDGRGVAPDPEPMGARQQPNRGPRDPGR